MEAEITASGDVRVEGQHVGSLQGFRFTADPQATGEEARTLNAAAAKALASEIEARANRFGESVDESIALANDGTIRWLGDPVAKLAGGDKLLQPRARLIADEHLTGAALETVQRRLDLWLAQHVKKLLGALIDLEAGEGLEGAARGLAFQLAEALGVLERARVADEVKALDQTARGVLRKLGIRFGAYHIYLPLLLKPAPRALASQLWALKQSGLETAKGLEEVPYLAASGRTSFQADSAVPKGLYRAAGFRVCGARAVRVDILERLADLIRPAVAYRPGVTPGAPPPGAADQDGFVTTVAMTSLAGCSGEDFASILRSLGYVADKRPGPPITVPLIPAAPTAPLQPSAAAGGEAAAEAAPADAEPAAGSETVVAEPESASIDTLAADAAAPRDPAEPVPEVPEEEPPTVPEPAREEPPHPDEDEPPAAPEEEPEPVGDPVEPENTPPPIEAAAEQSTDDPVSTEPSSEEAADEQPSLSIEAAAPAPEAMPSELPPEAAVSVAEPAAEAGVAADQADARQEPVLIEVWRPHRSGQGAQRRHERGHGRPQHARRGQDQRGNRGPRPQEPGGQPVAATAENERPAQEGGRHRRQDGQQGGERRQSLEKRFGGGPGPRPEGEGKPRFDQRRDRHGRSDGGRPQGGKPATWSSAEPRPARDRQPDPNSPFAKLAALKADLEAKSKKE